MKPPVDEAPSELFSKLMEMPRPSEVVDFPRLDANGEPLGRVRIQILTSAEHDKARELAQSSMKARGISREDMTGPALKEVLGDAIAKELIAMACVTEKDFGGAGKVTYGRIFRNATDVGALSADELLLLFNAYQLTQHKYGPFERNLEPGDIDAWIQRIGEGAAEFPLLSLALPQLVQLTLSLGERLYSSFRDQEFPSESSASTSESIPVSSSTGTTSSGSPADATSAPGSAPRPEPASIDLQTAKNVAEKFRER